MHVVYKITFLPHLNTELPKYYIGSKLNYKGNYFGSVASRKKFTFTENMTLKDWWKKQVKTNPDNFLFEIVEDCSSLDKHCLVEREKYYQLHHNVGLSKEYFNQSIASGLFVGSKKDNETKKKMSLSLKEFYQTDDGVQKRKRLTERNKSLQSLLMKQKWSQPSEKMLNRKISGRPKGVKELKKRVRNFQKVFDGIKFYNTAEQAALAYGITPTSVRRRCRTNYQQVWRYSE